MMWSWILAACALAFLVKIVGFLVPQSFMEKPIVATIANTMTIGLLAALIATNTFASGNELVIDARLAACAVAIALLAYDVPFLIVVISGGAASALVRLLVPASYEAYAALIIMAIAVTAAALHILRDRAMGCAAGKNAAEKNESAERGCTARISCLIFAK